MIMLLGGARCETFQTLEDSGLIKDLGQALGMTRLKYVKTYTPFGNKGGIHRSMCPYQMCLQQPLDMEERMNPYFLIVLVRS